MREESMDQKRATHEFEPLLDSQQAADLMRVHPETVKRRARRGEIPAIKLGKLWRFRASALESFVQEMMQDNRTQVMGIWHHQNQRSGSCEPG